MPPRVVPTKYLPYRIWWPRQPSGGRAEALGCALLGLHRRRALLAQLGLGARLARALGCWSRLERAPQPVALRARRHRRAHGADAAARAVVLAPVPAAAEPPVLSVGVQHLLTSGDRPVGLQRQSRYSHSEYRALARVESLCTTIVSIAPRLTCSAEVTALHPPWPYLL
eukprot:scaffold117435_cov71-Phaeocystis_antarctica.AAC.2